MSFSYIDIHSHLNFAAFDPVRSREGTQRAPASNGVDTDRDEVIERALNAGVALINVGTQKDTSRKAVEIAEKYSKGVYAIVGVHPIHTSKSFHDVQELGEGNREFTSRGEEFDYDYYKKLASHPKVVAIGECGLDKFRSLEARPPERSFGRVEKFKKQEEAFRKQIELANEVQKPLMLHVRNGRERSAYRDALALLVREAKVNGNFHFFAGGLDEACAILDAGFSISFTGVITFARDYDEVVRYAPLERIMSETDCPYATPAPFRGTRNEPAHVVEVVKKIAEIRGENFENVRRQLVRNALDFFRIAG